MYNTILSLSHQLYRVRITKRGSSAYEYDDKRYIGPQKEKKKRRTGLLNVAEQRHVKQRGIGEKGRKEENGPWKEGLKWLRNST